MNPVAPQPDTSRATDVGRRVEPAPAQVVPTSQARSSDIFDEWFDLDALYDELARYTREAR
jgi:hypothetical protein